MVNLNLASSRKIFFQATPPLKARVYSNNPQNLDELERNNRAAVRAIDIATLQKVFQNFECRLLSCIDNNGFEFEKYM